MPARIPIGPGGVPRAVLVVRPLVGWVRVCLVMKQWRSHREGVGDVELDVFELGAVVGEGVQISLEARSGVDAESVSPAGRNFWRTRRLGPERACEGT